MPVDHPGHGPRPTRDPATRRADHAAIGRLTDEFLPDLIDRLAASGLGEIEVREDDWRIRLRRPSAQPGTDAGRGPDRHDRADRATDRPDRGSDRSADRPDRHDRAPDRGSDRSADRPDRAADRQARIAPGAPGALDQRPPRDPHPSRAMAISPAVGVFQPRPEMRPGTRVRAGDRLAVVDLLGLPQEVVAPVDGVVVETLVQAGDGVEYGQDLIVIEPAGRTRSGADHAGPYPVTES